MNRKDIYEMIVPILLTIVTIFAIGYVGYIVLQVEVVQVREYCESLIANGTISNFSDCNITVQAN